MIKTKIGFIPSNWDAWDGGGWGGKMRDRCVNVLNSVPGIELVVPPKELTGDGCVSTIPQAKQTLELFKREGIQGLLIGNMTFGMEVAVGTILDNLPKDIPILHFCTRSGPILENGSRSTDTWCGQFMTTSSIKRRGFKFIHINTCNPEDEYFREKMEIFVRAVAAISNFRRARIGQIGVRPDLFESQFFNEQVLQKKFNQMVVPIDLDTVLTKIESISSDNPDVKRIMEEITSDVEIKEFSKEGLINLAKTELGLINIAKELELNALAVRCWTRMPERLLISPCVVLGRLNDQGIITSCETDLYGALTMWILYNASLRQSTPFFTDWTDLHPSLPNVWLAWHCGNGPRSLQAEDSKPVLTRNERMIQWCPTCFGALEFKLKTGLITCARLVEYDGEFTMFFGNGEVIDMPPFVRGTYGWVKVKDVFDWENKMAENGIIHHGALIYDHKVADSLEMFCKFLDIKPIRGE